MPTYYLLITVVVFLVLLGVRWIFNAMKMVPHSPTGRFAFLVMYAIMILAILLCWRMYGNWAALAASIGVMLYFSLLGFRNRLSGDSDD